MQTVVVIRTDHHVETGIDANPEDSSVISRGRGHPMSTRSFDSVGWHAVFVPVTVVLIHPLHRGKGGCLFA